MKDDGTISASEISEYTFCSVSWYMNTEGFPRSKISSQRMERGKQMHQKLEPRYRRAGYGVKFSAAAMAALIIIFIAVALGLI